MTMIKLVATDMDGTFLDGNGQYNASRLEAVLDRFDDLGIRFAVASGRSLLALTKMFEDFADRIIFIAENGNVVKVGDDIIFEANLSSDQYLDISKTLLGIPYMADYDFLLSGEKGAYVHNKSSKDYVDFISHYYENVQRVPDFDNLSDKIFKLTANFAEETVREGEAWVNQKIPYVQAVTTGFKSIDIILRDVDKSTGIAEICKHFGISQSEIIAFGDNLNDFEMLEYAGTAIATENARDEIKAISQQIIGPCHEESVMAYMEGMVK